MYACGSYDYDKLGNGNLELAKFLISKGADIEARDANGDHALASAALNRNVEIVKLLIDNGAYLLDMDKQGKTALDYQNNKETFPFFNANIIDKSKNNEMIKLLENAIETQDKQNRLNLALREYMENGDLPEIKDCLDKGANENYLWLIAQNIRDYINETK